MEQLLTPKQAMNYFQVKDFRTLKKFMKDGLKYIPIGTRDYRFKKEDLEEYAEHLKEQAQEKLIFENPIPRKHKSRTAHIDFEKIRTNRVLNRVI